MHLWCSNTGTTGSDKEAKKVSRAAATENTEPGISRPPVSNMSRIANSSPWRPPSVNKDS